MSRRRRKEAASRDRDGSYLHAQSMDDVAMIPDHQRDGELDEEDEEVTFRRGRQEEMRAGQCEEVGRAKATADEVRAEMRGTADDVTHMEKMVGGDDGGSPINDRGSPRHEGGSPRRTCGKQDAS